MIGIPRGLRLRSAAGFAVVAASLALTIGVATYQSARWYLADQREQVSIRLAVMNAQSMNASLVASGTTTDAGTVVAALAGTRARAILHLGDEWYSAVVGLTETDIPAALRSDVAGGASKWQRMRVNDTAYFCVGVPLPAVGGQYFEFVPAAELERTLQTLLGVLAIVGSGATLAGALIGWLLSRRVLLPLRAVAETAQAMSEGALHRRVHVSNDPDLLPVAESFNTMAASLEARIAREQRFTADVSHELRTPLTAMGSAVSLAKRAKTPERLELAVEVLDQQVGHLRQLTLELLELSRIDASQVVAGDESVDVVALITEQMGALGVPASVLVAPQPVHHMLNRTRFQRVVANLLENAQRYGNDVREVRCTRRRDGGLRVEVADRGPGVPTGERLAIFGRFARGSAEAPEHMAKGTGLGLSLVDEFVRLEGGHVWVEDHPAGGARFVVEVPAR